MKEEGAPGATLFWDPFSLQNSPYLSADLEADQGPGDPKQESDSVGRHMALSASDGPSQFCGLRVISKVAVPGHAPTDIRERKLKS